MNRCVVTHPTITNFENLKIMGVFFMVLKTLLIIFLFISIGGILFSLLCLAASGSGDHSEAFSTYLLCSSIILSSCLISMAISGKEK